MNYLHSLNYDTITEVCKYLSCEDIYNLNKCYSHEIFDSIMITKILDRIEKLFKRKDYNTFINFMKKTDCCISGSYILQCILDKEYNTDIDLYISMKYLIDIKELIKLMNIYGVRISNNYTDENNLDAIELNQESDFLVISGIYGFPNEETYNHLKTDLFSLDQYLFLEKKIQFILVKNDPINHIKKDFDLDIVSNYLNYENGKFNL